VSGIHSMLPEERALALEVLGGAWARLSLDPGGRILQVVESVAADLPRVHPHVSGEYAAHVGQAAVWYLDRAARRVFDPDRDGHTARQRAANLALFELGASQGEVERLFALASALDAEDE
jgi:hypothetical protein